MSSVPRFDSVYKLKSRALMDPSTPVKSYWMMVGIVQHSPICDHELVCNDAS